MRNGRLTAACRSVPIVFMRRPLATRCPILIIRPNLSSRFLGLMQGQAVLIDDRACRRCCIPCFCRQVRFKENRLRNTGAWILAVTLNDDVVEVLLVHKPIPLRTSTKTEISHMLETIASSLDMDSRVGRSSLMGLSASTLAPAFAPRPSGQGSSFGIGHHETPMRSFPHVRPRGHTTCGPG